MYPGYSGPRPRVELWHGTDDSIISYVNQTEAIKEWTNVLGLSLTPTSTTTVTIGDNQYVDQIWLDSLGNTDLEAFSEIGGPHGTDALFDAAYAIPFLGLDTTGSGGVLGSASDTDIGSPSPAGSSSYDADSNTYTVAGGGAGFGGTSDQFNYLSESYAGNGSIVARITTVQDAAAGAQAGVMIRNDSTTAGAMYADVAVTAGQGVTFQWRSSTGGSSGSVQVTGITAPAWVELVRSGNSFTAFYATTVGTPTASNWIQVGTAQTIAMSSTAQAGLAVTSDDSGTLCTSRFSGVQLGSFGVFGTSLDVGSPSPAGSSSYNASTGVYTVTGGGAEDIENSADQFQYLSQGFTEYGSIVARVTSVEDTSSWSKAGVMFRPTELGISEMGTDAYAMNAGIFATPGNGVNFQWRSSTGGSTSYVQVGGITAPVWLELVRGANGFSAYYATTTATPTASQWIQVGTAQTIPMGGVIQAGLAVTSHDNGSSCAATFTNATLTSTVDPPPSVVTAAAASPASPTGTTTNLSVAASDTLGASSLTYTWAATTLPNNVPTPIYSVNGANAANDTTVTFTQAGTYVFTVTITDPGGESTTSAVTVTVNQEELDEHYRQPHQHVAGLGRHAAVFGHGQRPVRHGPEHAAELHLGDRVPACGWRRQHQQFQRPLHRALRLRHGDGHGRQRRRHQSHGQYHDHRRRADGGHRGRGRDQPGNRQDRRAERAGGGQRRRRPEQADLHLGHHRHAAGRSGFSANGTNAAQNTTATFSKTGTYSFTVTITDLGGQSTISSVNVTVSPTATSIAISPSNATIAPNAQEQFSVAGNDQFGNAIATSSVAWSVGGGIGTINSSGLFVAGSAQLIGSVTATLGTVSSSATVNVTALPAPSAWYRFNEGSGTTLHDSSGNGYNGTISSSGATWTTGVPGSGGALALSSGSVNLGSPTGLNITGDITLSAWIDPKSTSSSGYQDVVDRGYTTSPDAEDFLRIGYGDYQIGSWNGTDYMAQAAVPTSDLNTWVQLVGVYNGTNWLLYRDGALLSSTASTVGAVAVSANWTIGSSGVLTDTRYFSGSVGDVRIYNSALSASQVAQLYDSYYAPTVSTAAAASPAVVTGTTATLSALGASSLGQSALSYTWSSSGPAAVSFGANGTNAAKSTVATFSEAGTYTLSVAIADTYGQGVTSSVTVTVDQTLTSVAVSPSSATLDLLTTQQFTATAYDQFGAAMVIQPAFTWSLASGAGSINSSGLYTSSSTAGSASVQAASGSISGTASVTAQAAFPAPTVATPAAVTPALVTGTTATLSVLGADDGGESNLTYTWNLMGTPPAPVTFSANGTNAAKNTTVTFTQAGAYNFAVTITDQNGLSTMSFVAVPVTFALFSNSSDVGSPALAGSISFSTSSAAYTVTAGGAGVKGTSDQFRYIYEKLPAATASSPPASPR